MRHQRTDLSPSKSKQKQQSFKSRSKSHKRYSSENNHQVPPCKKRFDPNQVHQRKDRCSRCRDSKCVESFRHPTRKLQCKTCNRYSHFKSLCCKNNVSLKSRKPMVYLLKAGVVYMQEDSICSQLDYLTSGNESFCLQVQIQHTQANSKVPTPHHLTTNLAYRLKPHRKRNQYLKARLDTYANVNIIPVSVYKLVFQDPDCKKLAPSKLDIGTYTTDTVKLVGSCIFYLVHPDTKCLQEVTFYVASYNGSVLLSCVTTLVLGFIQAHTRLDYLPPRGSLIASSADHLKKTKSQISVHISRKESKVSTMSNCKGMVPKIITSKLFRCV